MKKSLDDLLNPIFKNLSSLIQVYTFGIKLDILSKSLLKKDLISIWGIKLKENENFFDFNYIDGFGYLFFLTNNFYCTKQLIRTYKRSFIHTDHNETNIQVRIKEIIQQSDINRKWNRLEFLNQNLKLGNITKYVVKISEQSSLILLHFKRYDLIMPICNLSYINTINTDTNFIKYRNNRHINDPFSYDAYVNDCLIVYPSILNSNINEYIDLQNIEKKSSLKLKNQKDYFSTNSNICTTLPTFKCINSSDECAVEKKIILLKIKKNNMDLTLIKKFQFFMMN